MDIKQYAVGAAQRTEAALASGNIEDAIRISGEATATLDAEWTRLYNNRDSGCDNALIAGNFVAGRHLDALLQGGAAEEAFATGALLLYRSTMSSNKSAELSQSQLDILCGLLSAALETGNLRGYTSGDADAGDIDHFAHIVSYVASMLYAFYIEVGKNRPDTPMLEDAYMLLEQMREIGAVQYPSLRINDCDIDAGDIAAILPDLLGRSKALGMLNAE